MSKTPAPFDFSVRLRVVCVHCGAELPGCGLRGDYGGTHKFEINGFTSAERTLMVSPEHECGYLKFIGALCEDCPPVGYPTDKTRCVDCPRNSNTERSAP